MSLAFQSLVATARSIEQKEISPVELTETLLARIEELNGYYNAYACVDRDGAIAAARAAEEEIARGAYKGPLHGIPIGVKDIFATDNLPSRCGSVITQELLPQKDAPVVRNLRDAGAVILGKLTMTEFALSGYHPDLRPPQNPWGQDRWAGVSSSGSGVAVAAGLAFGALGTDTGGSIRYPSAANGVVGIKPTYGRLSSDGVFPLAKSLDHPGPFARRVEDAALLFNSMGGMAGADALGVEGAQKGMRIGVDRAFIEGHSDPEVAAAVLAALDVLADSGCEIVDVDFSVFLDLAALWGGTTAAEAGEAHKQLWADHKSEYGPVFADLLEAGFALTDEQIGGLHDARKRLVARVDALVASVDALACPSAPFPAMKLADFPPQAISPPELVSEFVAFTAPFNFSGHPTISAPCGFSTEGLPLSLQLVGQRNHEQTLVGLMAAYEAATDWKERRPPAPPR
jgi:amidase